MTARLPDTNGWPEIKGNPLSKVGVFPYSGRSIGADDPDKVYNVYRPEEELSNPETLDSFKLIPFVDDHTMLGDGNGLTPAEQKGVQGIIGEDVYFKDGVVYGNLKIFSEYAKSIIDAGKKELSAGYRCVYEKASGIWNGIAYDYIQRSIRGNHLALVTEGRMGPDVAVLDHLTFTFDAKELLMTDKTAEGAKAAMDARLAKALDWIDTQMEKDAAEEEEKKKAAEDKAVKDAAEEEEKKKKEAEDADEDKDDKKDGMDAASVKILVKTAIDEALSGARTSIIKDGMNEVSARNALANDLSTHIGTFDHANMTLNEVAKYGVDKLEITCKPGEERLLLTGYLAGKKADATGFALDQKTATKSKGAFDAYTNPKK